MLDSFCLVRLSQEALLMQCKSDDHEHWGAPLLDVAQWQQKDRVQRATRFSQAGALFWALVDGASDTVDSLSDARLEADRDLLYCHCKTLRFDCAVRRRSGDVERGFSYHVSSVYTLPAFRRRGLAASFLTHVAEQLAQLPNALLSVLYSDVGPSFYDKLGWRCHPSKTATLYVDRPRNSHDNAATDSVCTGSGVEPEPMFLDDGLDEFLRADNARLLQELKSDRFQGREAFVVLSSRDSVEWQFVNGAEYARVAGFAELPKCCGVKVDENAFVVWCHNLKDSTLYVLRARFPDPDVEVATTTSATTATGTATTSATGTATTTATTAAAVATTRALLDAAMQEARKFKLQKVAVWDPPSGLLHAHVRRELEMEVGERTLSLSSAMVLNGGAADEQGSLPHWFCNEKCAWV
jgi:GNAT superfamily N-acetyltransferase